MRGRKPVPTELKLLRGNPGKRALNESGPKPTPEIPEPPAHLSKFALEEWNRITVELHVLGLLARIDRATLAIYCMAWGRHVEAENHLLAEGLMPGGKRNRWIMVSNRAIDLIKPLIAEFGLSPSARTRLTVKTKPPKSPEEALFG